MDLIIKGNIAYWGDETFPCTHGRNGFTTSKMEGDGATPVGSFPFRRSFYRADRISKPITSLPLQAITPSCGWCDDPDSEQYNKYIQKPFDGSHEDLWLERNIYDLIIVVGHNDDPPAPHKGSAIFIHLTSHEKGPTQGCIGLDQVSLLKILKQSTLNSKLITTN